MNRIKIQRNFSPDIAEWLEEIDENQLRVLFDAANPKKQSKWKSLISRIETDPILKDPGFQQSWRKMKEEMKEDRENFEFKHDRER